MRKLLVVLLAMALLCAAAHADGTGAVLDYVEGELDLTPETMEQSFVSDALNLIVDGNQAFITWTDSAQSMAYGLSGQAPDMAAIYGELIPLAAWDSCALYENDEKVLGYDPAGDPAASLETYAAAVAERFAADHPAIGQFTPSASSICSCRYI